MKRFVVAVAVIGLCSCSAEDGDASDGEDNADSGGEEEAVDERVEMPAERDGVINFAGPDFVVMPGQDALMCMHVSYDGPEVAYNNAISLQGKGGHHVIFLGAKEPKPAGTVEDCSDGADMSKYDLLMIPQELPPGYGTVLPANRKIVIQSHYVNTTDKPIRVRDVVQLTTIPMEDVVTWAAPLATNTIDITLPPGKETEVAFDCTIENDVSLLMLGGHMHEWGTKFEALLGPSVDELEPFYLADPWQADFRDVPPVNLFLENPMPLAAGTVLRTHCTWNNTEAEAIEFPHEMCATFAIVAGTRDPIECRFGE